MPKNSKKNNSKSNSKSSTVKKAIKKRNGPTLSDDECKKSKEDALKFDKYHHIDAKLLENEILRCLKYRLSKDLESATKKDILKALSWAIKGHLIDHWIETRNHFRKIKPKAVCYISLEFLTGQAMMKSISNLGIYHTCKEVMENMGYDLEEIASYEADAALGNGGLGRLAACYVDSMSSVGIPAFGYGLRYEYGIFKQSIEQGSQVEKPETWLKDGNPWEIQRPECTYIVNFNGRVKTSMENGQVQFHWINTEEALAIAYDTPFPGFHKNNVNTLRLWSSEPTQEFNLDYFNHGDYIRAVEDKAISKSITRVLYPNDQFIKGLELRLRQEYFLVSATLQDIIKRYKACFDDFDHFPDQVAIQLNDTHPSLAIPELMRLLMDIEGLTWNRAWFITQNTFAYTNHTILPEALEKWSVKLLGTLLPRHLQIIYEINSRFLRFIANSHPGNVEKLKRVSLIDEGAEKMINMAHLSIVGSHMVNGVSKLHSDILKEKVFKDFYDVHPDRFTNKTNGITPRRWLLQANRALATHITEAIGNEWIYDLTHLKETMKMLQDRSFKEKWMQIKRRNKEKLAKFIEDVCSITVDPESIFDCQVKRIHEYKRQFLNILHVIHLYNTIKKNPTDNFVPRTFIFAGKAAPSYEIAKTIIKLINTVGNVVNNDPSIEERLKVVFIPDYKVSVAEKIMPAADLSEQISTAGFEASGTGNMKFALNGALTIGTLDGANIEIKEEVGDDNIFIFGMQAHDVVELKKKGYNPNDYYNNNKDLKLAIDMINTGFFCLEEGDLFKELIATILEQGDRFCVLADFHSYIECQRRVSETYLDKDLWAKKSIMNTANMGKFSADRAVLEYASEIWHVKGVDVPLPKSPHLSD